MAANSTVVLHIYDLDWYASAFNAVAKVFGGGLYHCGVEVYGKEWSFYYRSASEFSSTTGVLANTPRVHPHHQYRESVDLGTTALSEHAVCRLLHVLQRKWRAEEYDLLQKNCIVFCEAFARLLGVSSVPQFVRASMEAGRSLLTSAPATQVEVPQAIRPRVGFLKSQSANRNLELVASTDEVSTDCSTDDSDTVIEQVESPMAQHQRKMSFYNFCCCDPLSARG
jgi:hypothetical protein